MIDPGQLHTRTLVGFGASVAAVSTLAGSQLRPAFFVDSNPALHGAELAGAPVRAPDAIAAWLENNDRDQLFVMVFAYATRAVQAVFEQLDQLGLRREVHYSDCSLLHYAPMVAELGRIGVAAEPELFTGVRRLCLSSTLDNRSSIAGTWLIQQLVRHQLERVPGDLAEAGVYKGGSALMTLELLGDRLGDRPYHLFDSFAGLAETSSHDPASRAGEFADVTASAVARQFTPFANAQVHAGLFADRLGDVADRQFCFVYVDCDLYEPAAECCRFFYPRLAAGGIMLFHDYWVDVAGLPLPAGAPEPFTGIRAAVDELAQARGAQVLRFPQTTHALVRPR